jgi:hypothetical protein
VKPHGDHTLVPFGSCATNPILGSFRLWCVRLSQVANGLPPIDYPTNGQSPNQIWRLNSL